MNSSGTENLFAGSEEICLLGLNYLRLTMANQAELYLTSYGRPYRDLLHPDQWYQTDWFKSQRERLKGTSTIYRVPTKKVGGKHLDLVVKWSRVGQDVPLETRVLEDVLRAEFNSPFEEFSLVEEMRQAGVGFGPERVFSNRPLAIYVPPEQLQLWQTGRSRYKVNKKIKKHPGVELDILRQYILLYQWVKGIDLVEACDKSIVNEGQVAALTGKASDLMAGKGFFVADMKPAHVIVRPTGEKTLLKRRNQEVYALVDFELLHRTPEHEDQIRKKRRADYLIRQRDRFKDEKHPNVPAHLRKVKILGVDYIYGKVHSTGGALWVVGSDASLFDYFQPERWRNPPQRQLSLTHRVDYTMTKDNIHLVWKTCRVGEIPQSKHKDEDADLMQRIGYNSPFEEFAYALDLNRKGIATTYPRAVYRTGSVSTSVASRFDLRRFDSHAQLITPGGDAVLSRDYDYIKIWGFWNGPDEVLVEQDGHYCRGIDLEAAAAENILTEGEIAGLLEKIKARLALAGYNGSALAAHHLLVSTDLSGNLLLDADGHPQLRICNLEFIVLNQSNISS